MVRLLDQVRFGPAARAAKIPMLEIPGGLHVWAGHANLNLLSARIFSIRRSSISTILRWVMTGGSRWLGGSGRSVHLKTRSLSGETTAGGCWVSPLSPLCMRDMLMSNEPHLGVGEPEHSNRRCFWGPPTCS